MNHAVKNCAFEETVQVIADGCLAKNPTLAENSMGYMDELAQHMESGFYLEENLTVRALVK